MEEQMALAIKIGVVLGSILLITIGVKWTVRRLESRFKVKEHPILASMIETLPSPLLWGLWLYASSLILGEFSSYFKFPGVQNPVTTFTNVGLILIGTFAIYQCKTHVERVLVSKRFAKKQDRMDKAAMNAVARLTSILLFIGSGLTILDVIGVPRTTLLAFGGTSALGGALAAQDIVKNFFGGFMIYVMRPFTEGDWINSPDKNIEGTVEHIGWYQTQIRSFDKRPIYVPNAFFISTVVTNPSRMSHRRILETVGIRYKDFSVVQPICDEIDAMLRNHPDIATNAITMVHFVKFGPHSLDINIYTFTKTTDWATWRAVQQEILIKVGQIIEKHGAEVAFPTQTLHVAQQNHPIAPGASQLQQSLRAEPRLGDSPS